MNANNHRDDRFVARPVFGQSFLSNGILSLQFFIRVNSRLRT